MLGDVVNDVAIRRSLFFEKTLFDELRYGLRNLRRPFSNAGVEHPPVKDTVDGILCIRMPGQVVENFRSGRRESGFGEHTFGVSRPLEQAACLVISAAPREHELLYLRCSRELRFLL